MALPRDARAIQNLGPVYVVGSTCPYHLVWVDAANDPDPAHHHCAIPVVGNEDGGGGASDSGGNPRNGDDLPDPEFSPGLSCVLSLAAKYGDKAKKLPVATKPGWKFSSDSHTPHYIFSASSSSPPAGYVSLNGLTISVLDGTTGALVGGSTEIYVPGYTGRPDYWTYSYIDDAGMNREIKGPFTATEFMLMTVLHELAHQNGLRGHELKANGHGVKALKKYRADPKHASCE